MLRLSRPSACRSKTLAPTAPEPGGTARPMSQENVEIVRRIFEAWATGDFRAGIDDLDRHVMFVTGPDFPEFGVFVGPDGVRDFMQRFLEQWEQLTIEAKYLQAAGDTVLAHVVQHGKGKASGIQGDIWYFMLFTFRGKKIVRLENVMDEGEAREAAGLREPAMSHENVEIVREHFENTNRRRFDAVMQAYDPGVELVVSEDVAVDPGVYRGADAVGEWFGSWFRTFAPNYRLDVVELFPVNDAVVAAVDHHGVGRLSGVEVTNRVYNVYRLREKKIIRVELFRERSEALQAAGLPEQDARAARS